ncbi:MAG: excinuclease ABC subunit UvrC [Archangiaceae bacterium]|nr:excinuclease ABC subunit UvrC [Archangiaceae bacterium]
MTPELEKKLAELPTTPGVYLMKGRGDEIIYVGKAVNLRSRVRAYFTRTDTRAFVGFLDHYLVDLDTVTVKTEKEALLLENELIKKHKPRFNVQLRDDKNFLCLRLSLEHRYPRLETVRRIKRDGARYFGPYASAASIRETLRVVNKYFQLRTCTDYALETRRRPCLLHQIGRCPAPCVFPIEPSEYRKNVDAVVLFLEGRSGPLLDSLRARMKDAASKLAFEEAARLRDQVIALERSLERQAVAGTEAIDQDIFGFYREADRLLIYALYVRGGRIGGGQPFFFSGQEFPDEELLASFVNLYYDADNFVPKQVLLPFAPGRTAVPDGEGVEWAEALGELLTEKKGERVRVHVPQRGDKAELMRLASQNAERAFSERKRTREETTEVLERLQQRLHLKNVPHRMECFDISHFQGSSIVASQVASLDGEADKAHYRHFRLKTVTQNDDFASMHEVLSRRFRRGLNEGDLPDVIVIDGGKGQLASAHAAMKDLGVEGVDLVALAKSRDLEVEDRDVESKASPERVFLIDRKDPIVLPQSSPELFMLTRLRDEAHRFAITFQRKLLRKRGLASELEQIPGVGDGRKRTLLKHFGSVKRVREASIEELAEAVGPSVAERVHAWLHGKRAEDDEVREASLEDAGSPVVE